MSTIWSFDIGKAAVGEAVRCIGDDPSDPQPDEFLHKAVLRIPAEFASTRDARDRRRLSSTRAAHKGREEWLDAVWRSAAVAEMPLPLRKRIVERNEVTKKWELKHPADYRLEREFAPRAGASARDGAPSDEAGSRICYTSCLLRIKLLRGEKLEPWQIYKALHSAMQRRGYDFEVPWRSEDRRRRERPAEDEEEAGIRRRMARFVAELQLLFPTREDCQLPCYFDAVKMGLCDPANPDVLRERIDCRAESTRHQIIPRWLVEKEIRLLAEAAGRQIAGFVGQADFLLWGPARRPYASSHPAVRKVFGLREGGANDWQSVVGQKAPRFDNRMIDKCTLIPRLHVCKIKVTGREPAPESRLVFETTFLMRLKNMRVQRATGGQTGLTTAEIKAIFEDPEVKGCKITPTQWGRICQKFGATPLPTYNEVKPLRAGGRGRFCRPALEILKRAILSDQSFSDFYEEELTRLRGNTDPKRGLVEDDLKFLRHLGPTRESIRLSDQKLATILERHHDDADQAVWEIIGSQKDPIVRHRLQLFHQRLVALQAAYGTPQRVALKFAREDFMSKSTLAAFRTFRKKRDMERTRARADAAQAGATESGAGLKLELLRAQGGVCLYTGASLPESGLAEYLITPIVPPSRGGPHAFINYTVARPATHEEKGERTPFEWLSPTAHWATYVKRVRTHAPTLRGKKVKLLLAEDAAELASRAITPVETAWISNLTRAIVEAHFGWKKNGDPGGGQRIVVVNSGLAARIRRHYRLNGILHPTAADEEEAERKSDSDARRRALDAMVINFVSEWIGSPAREEFFRLPTGVGRETFARHLAEVIPRNLCLEKPALAVTIYGARRGAEGPVIVQRATIQDLAYSSSNPAKPVYDLSHAPRQIKTIRDPHIRRLLEKFVSSRPSEKEWKAFCASFALRRKDGSPASRVIQVLTKVGAPKEYKDLSKDQTGAWRKAKNGHRGQFVFTDALGKCRVRPVYAFESVSAVRQELVAMGAALTAFFRSGCAVNLTADVPHARTPLTAGPYILTTFFADGRARLTNASGQQSLPIHVSKLFTAGLKRVSVK